MLSYQDSFILLRILLWFNFAQEYPTRSRSWLAWLQLMEKALWTEQHIKAANTRRHFSPLLINSFFPQHGHSTWWDYRGPMGCAENSLFKSWWYWPLCCRTGDHRYLRRRIAASWFLTLGQAETPVNGGLTGPTFNCIKALQFKKLMDGDRFFFTHKEQTGSFTPTQLKEIRKR